MADEADPRHEAIFINEIIHYDIHQLVWIDEVHTHRRNYFRRHGWGRRGERTRVRGYFVRGQRFSTMGIISMDGVIGHYTRMDGIRSRDLVPFAPNDPASCSQCLSHASIGPTDGQQ